MRSPSELQLLQHGGGLTAAMLPPVGRELTHHRERGMEYIRDSRSFDAYQNHQKFQNIFLPVSELENCGPREARLSRK